MAPFVDPKSWKRQTDRQTGTETVRQTNRQTDRQTDRLHPPGCPFQCHLRLTFVRNVAQGLSWYSDGLPKLFLVLLATQLTQASGQPHSAQLDPAMQLWVSQTSWFADCTSGIFWTLCPGDAPPMQSVPEELMMQPSKWCPASMMRWCASPVAALRPQYHSWPEGSPE